MYFYPLIGAFARKTCLACNSFSTMSCSFRRTQKSTICDLGECNVALWNVVLADCIVRTEGLKPLLDLEKTTSKMHFPPLGAGFREGIQARCIFRPILACATLCPRSFFSKTGFFATRGLSRSAGLSWLSLVDRCAEVLSKVSWACIQGQSRSPDVGSSRSGLGCCTCVGSG